MTSWHPSIPRINHSMGWQPRSRHIWLTCQGEAPHRTFPANLEPAHHQARTPFSLEGCVTLVLHVTSFY